MTETLGTLDCGCKIMGKHKCGKWKCACCNYKMTMFGKAWNECKTCHKNFCKDCYIELPIETEIYNKFFGPGHIIKCMRCTTLKENRDKFKSRCCLKKKIIIK